MQKDFQIQTLMKQLLTNYQILTKLPQISHIFLKVQLQLFRPTASTL